MTRKPAEDTFGEWLRKRRRELDLTQQALADQAGCTRITLRRIEANTLKPSQALADVLLKKLGVPGSERAAWVRFARGLTGHPARDWSQLRTNLPSPLTSFIGREKEIAEIKAALVEHRLVTLTGSGGTGKTRLSLQVAADMLDSFPDGTWFIELAPLSNPDLIPRVIQNTLGLVEQKGVGIMQSLQGYLRDKQMLLMLDNCEHLIAACAQTAHELLSHSPHLKILASSREALGVHGEFAWRVPSLTLPNLDSLSGAKQLSQYEAVKLFVERARLVDPKFEVKNTNAFAIAQVCSRLDGIPLAIELAAARLSTLSVEQIHARLDDRLNLLTNGARTVLPRHQTLQATIDWSYNLLSEAEQTLFRRLAVFTSGWTLDAARSVCSGDELDEENIPALLTGLVRKSLVNIEEHDGEVRYRRLETIRQYARDKFFGTDDVKKVQDRYVQFYVEFAERAEPQLRSSDQVIWFRRLEVEWANLHSAIEWAKEQDKESFLRLTSSLWQFFRSLEHKSAGMDWLSKAVDANKDSRSVLLSTAAARLSNLCLYISVNQKQAEEYANAALELGRQINDRFAIALASVALSEIELDRHDRKSWATYIESALETAHELEDHWLIATVLLQKGKIDQIQNPAEGRLIFAEAVQAAQLSGDKHLVSSGLFWMCTNLMGVGDYVHAKEFARQRLSVVTEIDDKDAIIFTQNILAGIELLEENYVVSEQIAGAVIKLARSHNHDAGLLYGLGSTALVNLALKKFTQVLEVVDEMEALIRLKGGHLKTDVGYHLFLRAWVFILKGEVENTATNAKELIDTFRHENNILLSIELLRILASWKYIDRDLTKCVTLMRVARILRGNVVAAYFDYPFMVRHREEQLARCREILGEEVFGQAWEVGSAMTVEAAIQYALDDTGG